MTYPADRVKDTTTSTGTGAITLANSAPAGFQTLASAHGGAGGTRTVLCIVGGAEWEVVQGIFDGTTGFTRDTVFASSNAGALVNFSAGTKDVFEVMPAAYSQPGPSIRAQILTNYGL
jgi:hypothetical protein